MNDKPKPAAGALWVIAGLLILAVIAALLFGHRAATATGIEVWTIRILAADYDRGEVTVRMVDFDALVRAHNAHVERLRALARATGCT